MSAEPKPINQDVATTSTTMDHMKPVGRFEGLKKRTASFFRSTFTEDNARKVANKWDDKLHAHARVLVSSPDTKPMEKILNFLLKVGKLTIKGKDQIMEALKNFKKKTNLKVDQLKQKMRLLKEEIRKYIAKKRAAKRKISIPNSPNVVRQKHQGTVVPAVDPNLFFMSYGLNNINDQMNSNEYPGFSDEDSNLFVQILVLILECLTDGSALQFIINMIEPVGTFLGIMIKILLACCGIEIE